jgi:hypothetical protein
MLTVRSEAGALSGGLLHGGDPSQRARVSRLPAVFTQPAQEDRPMVQVTYPGVYVVEVPSGVHTIAGVSTSVAAFVDRFVRGPDNRAVQIFGLTDFAREFGGLSTDSPASYAIQQFFLNGGTEAWVVRVGLSDPADPYAASKVDLAAGGAAQARVFAGKQLRGQSVENPGIWGDSLRVEVDYDTVILPGIDPDGVLTATEMFNLTVSQVEVRNGRTFVVATETFTNLTFRAGAPTNALAVVNEGSRLVQVELVAAAPVRPDASGTLGGAAAVIPTDGDKIDITIGATTATAVLDYGGSTPASIDRVRPFLEAAIRASAPNDPRLAGATVQFANGAFRVLLGRSGSNYSESEAISFANGAVGTAAADLGLDAGTAVESAQQLELGGGGDGIDITDAQLRGVQAAKSGMYALEDVSLFNILCLPAAADLPATQMFNTYAEATTYCEERRAFLIVDIPEDTDTLDDMQGWLTDNDPLRHRNAAVYFPPRAHLRPAEPGAAAQRGGQRHPGRRLRAHRRHARRVEGARRD